MTETTLQTSDRQAENSRAERRAGRPSTGDRPPQDRAFAAEPPAGDRVDIPVQQAMGASLDIPHEAVQASQDIIRAGQRAAAQTTEMWRHSLEPLATLQTEMNHWFNDLWRRSTGLGTLRPMQTARPFAGGGLMALMGTPPADMKETDTAYRVCVEVPGVAPTDLEVGLRGDALVVSGQKAEEHHECADSYQISERRYGSFERSFPVPPEVDRGAIDARLENGLLRIDLPKKAQVAAPWSKIEVRAA